tara:strand:- start:8 stop:205 length:198 start_codon:yes stop_codon:yes gene_type:complete
MKYNKTPTKIKKELLYWLSKKKLTKKNLRVENINKISNDFIESLKNKCNKKHRKKSVKKKCKKKV